MSEDEVRDPFETDEARLRHVPELVHIAFGLWLFTSAFVWSHYDAEQESAWIVAVAITVVALFAMIFPWLRHVNAALAIWLFVSAFVLPASRPATVWSNVCVAIAVLLVSLVPADATKPKPASCRSDAGT
jgi:hypothetical protein